METTHESVADPVPDPEEIAKAAAAPSQSSPSTSEKVKETISGLFSSSGSSKDIEIGSLGILHPTVLAKFEIDAFTASAIEFNVEPFL